MAIHQIITVPDEILRNKSAPVTNINTGVIRLLENMKDTMYAFDGQGLAAPQIGVSKRIIIVDGGDNLLEVINPEIIFREGEKTATEGCLSVPDVIGLVSRSAKVIIKGLDRHGEEFVIEASDTTARAFQHEIDHLDGIIFTDLATETRHKRSRPR